MTEKNKTEGNAVLPEKKSSATEMINILGDVYYTRLTKKFGNRKKWTKPDDRKLFSYIPGTVCKIFVKPGDRVDHHSRLLLLEAMKMQNVIQSPVEGIVKTVLVKEGDKICKGVLMIEFEG